MDCMEVLFTRRSVRQFAPTPISADVLETLLRAAMVAPTARNTQGWRFVVIDDRTLLDNMTNLSPYASPAKEAPLAILVCGDTKKAPGYWPQDASAAIQNIMLAARALDIGSVWCGIHPQEDREQGFIKVFGLPETVKPLGMVVLGYPAHPDKAFRREDRYDPAKIHHNHW